MKSISYALSFNYCVSFDCMRFNGHAYSHPDCGAKLQPGCGIEHCIRLGTSRACATCPIEFSINRHRENS